MKKGTIFTVLLTTLVTLALVSCKKEAETKIEAVPFQETEDGQWGMISVDGKVLFKDEFKKMPTVVRDGRFFVKNKDGILEMYDATEKPKRIGKDYVHATSFQNGRAIVAEKGKNVSIIDKDGNTVKVLDKVDGKEVEGVEAFKDGYAIFMTADSLMGVYDFDGDCTVSPKEYCYISNCGEGKFLAIDKKYKKDLIYEKRGKIKVKVIDAKGNELFSFNGDKYDDFSGTFTDGKMVVSVKKDGKNSCGLIDDKGNYVLKPSSKVESIGTIHGDKFTYSNGDGWGLMDINGQTIIRAKYDALYYDSDNLLVAATKDGDDVKYKYIDEKDNQIGKDTYVLATEFSLLDGEHALVKPDDKMYSIIDRDGNQLKDLPDMVNVGMNDGDGYVESDYVDMQKIISDLGISANGVMGFTFNSTPQDVVKAQVKDGNAAGDANHPAGTPYWYDYTSDVNFNKNISGAAVKVSVAFPNNLSRQTYTTKRVIDYEFYDEYWYHDEQVPTGYVWNPVRPNVFAVTIRNDGRMHGKMRDMLKALISKFSTFGKIVKKNDGAAVLTLNNGKTALICMFKDHVVATWGALGDANAIDIDKYKDVVEGENDPSSSDDNSLESLSSNEDYAATDSAAADTATVDSAVADYAY